MCLNSKWHLKLNNQCLWNHLYNNCFQLATVREHFKDITNELENIPVSILLILYCGCFTSTSKYAAKNCWAQPPTKSVGLHWLVVGWGLILCQILLIMWTEKIFNFVKIKKNILQVQFRWTNHLTQSQCQNDSHGQASMPVPRQETWASACVHLVSKDCHKWQCL